MHQDVGLYAAVLDAGERPSSRLAEGRHAWVHVARGDVAVNGKTLGEGDGAALSDEPRLEIRASSPSEVLVFDLA